jgi:hypothetical protein
VSTFATRTPVVTWTADDGRPVVLRYTLTSGDGAAPAAWRPGGFVRRSTRAWRVRGSAVIVGLVVLAVLVVPPLAHEYEQLLEPEYRSASIDLFLSTAVRGRGLGPDAIRMVAHYLTDVLGHHRLTIDPAAEWIRPDAPAWTSFVLSRVRRRSPSRTRLEGTQRAHIARCSLGSATISGRRTSLRDSGQRSTASRRPASLPAPTSRPRSTICSIFRAGRAQGRFNSRGGG